MPGFISDSLLARELISIGDEAIATEDDAQLRACRGRPSGIEPGGRPKWGIIRDSGGGAPMLRRRVPYAVRMHTDRLLRRVHKPEGA